MKKTYNLLFAFLLMFANQQIFSQNSIPNSDFETWTKDASGSDSLAGWTSSNEALSGSIPSWLYQSGSSHSGSSAASLGSTGFGFAQNPVNGILVSGSAYIEHVFTPKDQHYYRSGGGTPISIKPTSLTGYYRYEILNGPDHALGIVLLSVHNQQTNKRDTVGFGHHLFNLTTGTTYSSFSISISDLAPLVMPDSITVLFYASDTNNVKIYNTLYLDDISLCGPSPLSLGNDTTIMAGQSINLNAGTGYTNYLWFNGSTATTTNVGATGYYFVTVTDSNNCIFTDSLLLTVQCPVSTLEIGNDTSALIGEVINLDAGPGYASYLWSTTAITQSINVTTTGIYSVTVKDANNCSYADTATVTIIDNTSINNLGKETAQVVVSPNPAKDKVSFTFSLDKESTVELMIYNTLYREAIESIISKPYQAGVHSLTYDIRSLTNGTYFYKIKVGGNISTGKLIIQK